MDQSLHKYQLIIISLGKCDITVCVAFEAIIAHTISA